MKFRVLLAAIFAAALSCAPAFGAATLLPNGEQCFSGTTGINGFVGTLGPITGGTGGTSGVYAGVPLTGGSGSGATANITVAAGAVSAVAIVSPGTQYVVGDTLSAASANIGNVSGFSVTIASVAINSALAGGSVAFYIPSTLVFKQTWSNSTQTVLNTNPVQLNQNGCAVIYGTGMYREIVKDALGNTLYDQLTTDTSANNNTFWAGLAGGTPNVITIVDPGFSGTDGSLIGFTAISTNTSSVTLNPSGFSPIPVLKVTTAGPVALVGNGTEIVQGNPIWVQFSATLNAFLLTNPPIQSASGGSSPMCGAVGLKITNSSGTPNTIAQLTANQAITQTLAGIVINRSNVSVTVNTSLGNVTSTAGGMDGEAIPASTAGWIDIFLIDNGSAPAALGSLAAVNGQSPNMPSGYTYKCYLGAMRFDTSSNLLRTLQVGNVAQYVVTAATNTAVLPQIVAGASGSISAPTWTSEAVSNFVPPTAPIFRAVLWAEPALNNSSTPAGGMVAPNNSYGPVGSTTNPPPLVVSLSSNGNAGNVITVGTSQGDIVLEGPNVFYACAVGGPGGSCVLAANGWKDAINAN